MHQNSYYHYITSSTYFQLKLTSHPILAYSKPASFWYEKTTGKGEIYGKNNN